MFTTPTLLLSLLVPAFEATACAAPQNPKATKTLGSWVKQYRSGKIDVGDSDKNIAGKSLAKKAGLVAKNAFPEPHGRLKAGQFSYRDEIEILLKAAATDNSKKAAQVMLECAAAGIDPSIKWTASMNPWYVRKKAEEHIKSLSSPEARDYLAAAAKGSPAGPKKSHLALQAAATRVLGVFKDRSHLTVIQDQLKSKHALVRGQAAQGLAIFADPKAFKSLVDAAEKESDLPTRDQMLWSIMQIFGAARGGIDNRTIERCRKIATEGIAKGSWRNSYAAIDFARFSQSIPAIPKLIGCLARFSEHPDEITSGKLAGTQRHLAYEVLTGITGAYYPIDDTRAWKEYWERVKNDFKPARPGMEKQRRKRFEEAERKRKQAAGNNAAEASTEQRTPTVGMSTGTVFGTPIRGGRILFVMDCSTFIEDPMQYLNAELKRDELKKKKRLSRLDAVKLEFIQAIESLTSDTRFNVVASGTRARMWKKAPVPATAANKKAAAKFIKSQGKAGYSNTWDGLAMGLGIEKMTMGNPGTHNIDEVFFAMVRQPEQGKITHPWDIVDSLAGNCQLTKTRINSCYVGAENDENDRNLIGKQVAKLLAERTGGKFIRP